MKIVPLPLLKRGDLWFPLAFIPVLLLSACNRDESGGTANQPRVALIMKSLANEFFLTMANGAKKHQAAPAADYELIVNGIKNETDLAEQMVAQQVIVIATADQLAVVDIEAALKILRGEIPSADQTTAMDIVTK